MANLFNNIKASFSLAIRIIHSLLFWLVFFLYAFIVNRLINTVYFVYARNKKKIYHKELRLLAKIIIFIAGIKLEVEGLENIPNERPLIFMPNHQGHADYFVLLASLPLHILYVSKKENFSMPFFGNYIKNAGWISIDRENTDSAHKVLLNEIMTALKDGTSLVIFPEGTRTDTGEIGVFKRGGMFLASETNFPVVPAAISGSFNFLKKGKWIINPGIITVKYGKAISFAEIDKLDFKQYNATIRAIRNSVLEMFDEINKKM